MYLFPFPNFYFSVYSIRLLVEHNLLVGSNFKYALLVYYVLQLINFLQHEGKENKEYGFRKSSEKILA